MIINQEKIKENKTIIFASVSLILYTIIYYTVLNVLDNEKFMIFINIIGILGLGISLLIIIYAISRHTLKSLKNMWELFAVGIFFNILGDIVWTISEAMNNLESFLLIADILYSIQTILFVVGIYKFALRKGNPRRLIKSIDIIIGLLIMIILELKFIIIPIFTINSNSGILSYLSLIYPVADLMMLIILTMLVMGTIEKKVLNIFRLMFIPIIINIVANQVYFIEALNNNYISGSWLDPLWPTATWLLAIIAIISAEVKCTGSENEKDFIDITGVRQSIRNVIVILVYVAFIIFGAYVFSRYLIIDVLSVGFLIIITILIIRDMYFSIRMGKLFEKIKVVNKDLEILNVKLDVESKTDYLTGLNNRRQIMKIFSHLKNHTIIEGSILSVIMIDIDNFKNINDRYGHEAGDKVLKRISELLLENTRDNDYVGRFGGEEFIILMPHCDKEKAFNIAERIRIIIEKELIVIDTPGLTVNVTISVGISCLDSKNYDNTDTINEADKALYLAKDKGRNLVIKYNDTN